MGTNYYFYPLKPCVCCGRPYEPIHIGKSSGGWCFSLHVYPEKGINNLSDWLRRFDSPDTEIVDEYGATISATTMRGYITNRKGTLPWKNNAWTHYKDEADFHNKNHSERGPYGLLRHKIGSHCIAHGEGTWDCIIGDFS